MAVVEPDDSSRAVQPAAAAGRAGSTEPGLVKRLITVLRAVYLMLRRGRKRLTMDARLVLGRGNRLAGKALRDLLAAAHHHHHPQMVEPSSSQAATSGLSFVPYNPGDVEFSCTTTPSSYSFGGGATHPGTGRALFPFRIRRRGRGAARASGGAGCDGLDFDEVAQALEMMHATDAAGSDHQALSSLSPSPSVSWATPSPMLALSLGRSPAGVRRLRVTDSPFPLDPPEGLVRSDSSFKAFIDNFREKLGKQPAEAATPDNRARRRG